MKHLRKIEIFEYEPIYCPAIKKHIDPYACHDTKVGNYNHIGIDEAWVRP